MGKRIDTFQVHRTIQYYRVKIMMPKLKDLRNQTKMDRFFQREPKKFGNSETEIQYIRHFNSEEFEIRDENPQQIVSFCREFASFLDEFKYDDFFSETESRWF